MAQEAGTTIFQNGKEITPTAFVDDIYIYILFFEAFAIAWLVRQVCH